MFSALWMSVSLAVTCPAIDFGELTPPEGARFTYEFWRNNDTRPGLYRVEITRSAPGAVRAEETFFLINQEWTEPELNRVVAGVVLRDVDSFNGVGARQLDFSRLDPPLEARELQPGSEIQIPVRHSAPGRFGLRTRNQGAYLLSHIGCGEIVDQEGQRTTTRMLQVTYPRYISRQEGEWRLTENVQVYHLPVGAPWFFAVHRAGNHPMQQGTILQGYQVP